MRTKLLHRKLIYYLQGLGFEIHTALGGGHAEENYEDALAYALDSDGTPFVRQPTYRVLYRDRQVGKYRPDIVVADGKVLLELKARPSIEPIHIAQTLSILRFHALNLALS